MAEETVLADLEKDITCVICHDIYTEPKVLPCHHCYCEECLQRLAERAGLNKPFSCPECRKSTTLPEGRVDNLQSAFFINRLIEKYHRLKDALRMPSLPLCKIHGEPLKMFCFDCKTPVCLDCTVKIHSTHKLEFIKVAASEVREELTLQLDPLKEAKEALLYTVQEIQRNRSKVQTQGMSVKERINNSFDEIVKIVEQCRRALLMEADRRVTSKCDNLSSQEEKLSTRHARIHSAIDHIEHRVQHAADDDIMYNHGELRSLMEELMAEHHEEEKSPKPLEEADMGVEVGCFQEIKQLCQEKVKLTKLAELFALSRFTFSPKNRGPNSAKCELKSLVDGSSIKCNVDQTRDDVYQCEFIPTVRGRHELSVSVNGQEVAGSPFPVHASIQPTQLSKTVRVISMRNLSPRDVAISSSGKIIVTFEKTFAVFDKSGKKLQSYEASYLKMTDLWSVTLDSRTNNIFITGNASESHRIVRLDLDFIITKEVSINGRVYYSCLAVVGDDRIMYNSNEGCVLVYTPDLEFVGRINSGEFGVSRGISSDKHGNLYVCDFGKSCIHVFISSGEFLCSFKDKLTLPYGICVSGRYVYVCDHNHKLVIFTTEGQYVTSIGQQGQGKDDLYCPCGVCVDSDGFVYVCDAGNHRLLVF